MAKNERKSTGEKQLPDAPEEALDKLLDEDTLNDDEDGESVEDPTDELDITSINLDDTGPIEVEPDLWNDTAPIPELEKADRHPMFQNRSTPVDLPSVDEEEPDTVAAPLDPADFGDLDDEMESPPPIIEDDDDEEFNINLDLEDHITKAFAKSSSSESESDVLVSGLFDPEPKDDGNSLPSEDELETPTISDNGAYRTLISEVKPTEPLRKETGSQPVEEGSKRTSKSTQSSTQKKTSGKTAPAEKSSKEQKKTKDQSKKSANDSNQPTPSLDDAVDEALAILQSSTKQTEKTKASTGKSKPKKSSKAKKESVESKIEPESAAGQADLAGTSEDKDGVKTLDSGEVKSDGELAPSSAGDGGDQKQVDLKEESHQLRELPTVSAEPSPPLLTVLEAMDRGISSSLQGESPDTPARAFAIDLHDQHLLFRMGESHYAVPFLNVLEIGRTMPVTPVPNVPDWILGVTNLRGDIMSVVDLSKFFGLGVHDIQPSSRMIIMRSRDDSILTGCVVPRLEGSHVLPPEDIRTPAGRMEGRTAEFLSGVFTRNQVMVAVLDAEAMLRSEAFHSFGQ